MTARTTYLALTIISFVGAIAIYKYEPVSKKQAWDYVPDDESSRVSNGIGTDISDTDPPARPSNISPPRTNVESAPPGTVEYVVTFNSREWVNTGIIIPPNNLLIVWAPSLITSGRSPSVRISPGNKIGYQGRLVRHGEYSTALAVRQKDFGEMAVFAQLFGGNYPIDYHFMLMPDGTDGSHKTWSLLLVGAGFLFAFLWHQSRPVPKLSEAIAAASSSERSPASATTTFSPYIPPEPSKEAEAVSKTPTDDDPLGLYK